jgi:hypothetical protein
MLAHSQPVDNTVWFGWQWASSCSGKNGFGPAPSIFCCRHDDLHSIRTMMGFHTAISRQNETFHRRNHMNIIIQTRNGKDGSKLSCRLCYRGANHLAIEMNFCVGLSFIFEPCWRLTTAHASPQPAFR